MEYLLYYLLGAIIIALSSRLTSDKDIKFYMLHAAVGWPMLIVAAPFVLLILMLEKLAGV